MMKALFYNGNILTQSNSQTVSSVAICSGKIVAVGNNLEYDSEYKSYKKIDLHRRTMIPGMVDAHTHLYYMAMNLGKLSLHHLETFEEYCNAIREFSSNLGQTEWMVGEGFVADRIFQQVMQDSELLDRLVEGRPAFLFSKDQHTAWVNQSALRLSAIDHRKTDPNGGEIVRDSNGRAIGILREKPAYISLFNMIPRPNKKKMAELWRRVLSLAYEQGVTGVHSFDSPESLEFFQERSAKGTLGLRINYYPVVEMLPLLKREKIGYGYGDEYFRVAGVKIFADGALGSQTALCFNSYIGSEANQGIEVTSVSAMSAQIKQSAKLGLPCAIHAIGDRAVSNVIDAIATSRPLSNGARHRIEHMQLIRRKDIVRLKQYNIIASMQPSHCPSDVTQIRQYWGQRGRNAFIFKTLIDRGIDLAFGSDAPIERISPFDGIVAAMRRNPKNSRPIFYPEERISASDALACFTVGPAIACGQSSCRGKIEQGFPADLVILSDDISRASASRIEQTRVIATIFDGKLVFGAMD